VGYWEGVEYGGDLLTIRCCIFQMHSLYIICVAFFNILVAVIVYFGFYIILQGSSTLARDD